MGRFSEDKRGHSALFKGATSLCFHVKALCPPFFVPLFYAGNGGTGGTEDGSGGSSGNIGDNGEGGDGGLIKETSQSGTIGVIGKVEGKFENLVAAGGVVAPIVDLTGKPLPILDVHLDAPSQAKTGNGGNAVTGNGGSSGDIGTNGSGGDGGEVVLTTVSGNITMPTGVILTAGGDGGTAFIQTGNGGSTDTGNAGSSGDIGRNSNGGNAGPITLKSTFGNINTATPLILRGAMASNSGDQTGNGGTSSGGAGGNTGTIGSVGFDGKLYAGGTAGDGGKLTVIAGGSITTSEASVATGGDAGALSPVPPPGLLPVPTKLYQPITGNGGSGTSQGGNSGSIGIAGAAGDGGEVIMKTVKLSSPSAKTPGLLNITPDRINVNGGRAGTNTPPPSMVQVGDVEITLTISIPAGDGVQRGITGNGGGGGAGGNAGTVGGGVVGGDGGTIEISSAGAISKSVDYLADGGFGGDQAGTGGNGGKAAGDFSGGNGGSVEQPQNRRSSTLAQQAAPKATRMESQEQAAARRTRAVPAWSTSSRQTGHKVISRNKQPRLGLRPEPVLRLGARDQAAQASWR
jgi:hypothetical protein